MINPALIKNLIKEKEKERDEKITRLFNCARKIFFKPFLLKLLT
jgi:hypothetical protein